MDLKVPKVPKIEIVQLQNTEESIASILQNEVTHMSKKKSESSSSDDSYSSFRKVQDASDSLTTQLMENIQLLFASYEESRKVKDNDIQSLFENATKDYLDVLQRIQKFNEQNKIFSETNRQLREDFGSLKDGIHNVTELYNTLKSGLETTQERVDTLQKIHMKNSQTTDKLFDEEMQSSKAFLQDSQILLSKIKESTSSENYTTMHQRIEKLEAQCNQLACQLSTNPILNKIMSTPRLNSSRNQELSEDISAEQTTLEDILEQQQKELLHMAELIRDLPKSSKPDNTIANLITEVTALKSNNHSLMRKVQLYMTGSAAVLLASLWFWFQTHKA